MFKKTKKKIIEQYLLKKILFLNQKTNLKTTDLIFVNFLAKEKEINNFLILEKYEQLLSNFYKDYLNELQLITLKKSSILYSLIDPILFLKLFNELSLPFTNDLKKFLDEQLYQANCWLEEIHQEQYPFYWEKVN
jgi:hypothetical protein